MASSYPFASGFAWKYFFMIVTVCDLFFFIHAFASTIESMNRCIASFLDVTKELWTTTAVCAVASF